MGKVGILPADIIGLDTNIFISAFNKGDVLGKKAIELLDEIKQNSPRVYISVLVFQEFLVKIFAGGLEKDAALYEDFITAGGFFTPVDVDREIARKAAKIRAEYPNVRTPDAIHLATALSAGVKTFFTFEKKLPKKISNLQIKVIE